MKMGQVTGVKEVDVEMGWVESGKLASRHCDNCRAAAAAVFCKADDAFLCLGCDSEIHGANKLSSRHQRMWMCEVCERDPAAVACKADAAVLCVSCDADIHSANSLAGRHKRFSVEPFCNVEDSVAKVAGMSFLMVPGSGGLCEVEEVATSWLLPNPSENPAKRGGDLSTFDETDPSENSIEGAVHGAATDSLVPTGGTNRSLGKGFDLDFRRSKIYPLIYENNPDQSLNHSVNFTPPIDSDLVISNPYDVSVLQVSSSTYDFGVVPDSGNSKGGLESSDPFIRSINTSSNTDPNNSKNTMATVTGAMTLLGGLDRKARVLRYKEKRKHRKFEKTVRYASRKAYAESRPRIKGRFVKQTEAEDDSVCDTSHSDGLLGNEYGVVPAV